MTHRHARPIPAAAAGLLFLAPAAGAIVLFLAPVAAAIVLFLAPVAAAIMLLLTPAAMAQTTLNPDISLIGEVRAFSHDDESRPDESKEFNLASPQMELFISGYLNPYAEAAATIAWHEGHDAVVEELYGTILRGLPLGTNLRAGRYRTEFGRLNPVHPHAYSFLETPLPHRFFFGEEGLSDTAVRAAFLIPTGPAYTEVMGAVLKGDALRGHDHEHDHAEEGAEEEHLEWPDRVDPGWFGRASSSFAVSPTAELAVGASVLNTVHRYGAELEHDGGHEHDPDPLRATVAGIDFKYKSRPSRYTALQIEAEGLIRVDETAEGDDPTSYGAYGYLDYRFRQRFNAGGIFEWTRLEEAHHHDHEDKRLSQRRNRDLGGTLPRDKEMDEDHGGLLESDIWRAGVFIGFSPVEETSLFRLAGHWTEPEEGDGFWEVALQFVFSLGPHKPHNF